MDDATLEAARLGDRTAQAALLRALQDPWYRMCLSLLGDPEQARDATQETAVRFLSGLPSFRGASHVRTWSLGIAINVVREMRRAARPTADTDFERHAAPDPGGLNGWAPDGRAESAEAHALLRETLADLPDRQREAVVLRFFEDLSVEQTAKAMHCAAGTVKATVHQALRTLRKRLRQLV